MFWIYWAIWVFMLGLVIWNLFEEKSVVMRFVYGILVVPFLLRVLMFK